MLFSLVSCIFILIRYLFIMGLFHFHLRLISIVLNASTRTSIGLLSFLIDSWYLACFLEWVCMYLGPRLAWTLRPITDGWTGVWEGHAPGSRSIHLPEGEGGGVSEDRSTFWLITFFEFRWPSNNFRSQIYGGSSSVALYRGPSFTW